MTVVEAHRLLVAVPAPQALAACDQVKGVTPCLQPSVELHSDVERTATGKTDEAWTAYQILTGR